MGVGRVVRLTRGKGHKEGIANDLCHSYGNLGGIEQRRGDRWRCALRAGQMGPKLVVGDRLLNDFVLFYSILM